MHFLLTALVTVVYLELLVEASTIAYNVISVTESGHTMGVLVDGKTYPLQASKVVPVLHSGTAPPGTYCYVKLNGSQAVIEQESFERQLYKALEATLNEFYHRTWNIQHVPELPILLDALPAIHRSDSPLQRRDQVATLYVSGDRKQIDLMHSNVTDKIKVPVDVHLIETDKITTVNDATIKLGGHSSKWVPKLSYSLKTPKDQGLLGFRHLKLRASGMDSSFLREILCYDIMKSMGLPVSGASYVRVIINDESVGLFLLFQPYKGNWYKNQFGGGEKLKNGQGITYQGVGGLADLSPLGDDMKDYKKYYKIVQQPDKNHGPSSYDRLLDFTNFLVDAPTTAENASDTWNKHIDVESVIRSMVVEIIGGLEDGYFGNANNYFLYDNLAEKRFTFLAADFDHTLGNGVLKVDDMWSGNYTQYPGFSIRPLTQKLIKVPAFKLHFEHLLLKAAQRLISPASTNPRIDGLVKMLHQDVEWDASLPRMNEGSSAYEDNVRSMAAHKDNMYPLADPNTIISVLHRKHLPWDTIVDGPTHQLSLTGVREWFEHQSRTLQDYFTQYPPSIVCS